MKQGLIFYEEDEYITPISVAQKLIEHKTALEATGEMSECYFNGIVLTTFTKEELREIAEHLLAYCNNAGKEYHNIENL